MGRPETIAANILEPPAALTAIAAHVRADAHLMERLQEGDREAFAELYRAHHPTIFRFAFYIPPTATPRRKSRRRLLSG
jgi:hypothetical protein